MYLIEVKPDILISWTVVLEHAKHLLHVHRLLRKLESKKWTVEGGDEINQSQRNLGFGAVRIENSIDDSSFDRGF